MDVEGVSIVARGITATGPEGIVFENVDARVYPGELAVVLGEGGTGRTSLLLALSGRLRTVAGRIEIDEAPRRAGLVRKVVVPARLSPGFELDGRLRVREAVRERRITARVSAQDVDRALALVGVDVDRAALIDELYPDDRLLLAIALATAGGPPGIVVDDVTAGLLPSGRNRVWSALRAVADTGTTVLASATEPGSEADVLIRLPYNVVDFGDDTGGLPLFSSTAGEDLR
ncbi:MULTISPECIES: ATP-binding cassette domain-containing protein [Saccharopolyspora]|uniref:ABC transporter domain-containing protein n=1 Tax=Saccharopolyspora gregorii TaxID=33914 RepID=A0ABP6RYV5_9PSEU|nr:MULTISPECIES: ATP-binding cassette domain-containing protein [Saccharopolyspora]MCA1188622.1 ATP-binding cassette domain-containing protein [Saccharopolyspora sp. 6T]MCA1193172.1 ATP-binding cassette domain-containing protein [Saccharopolyspora sp. 6V]MCA1227852.1 ATP-binding cassette domain-containing protein [Saccharopolyspora sp. 6M]MCA1281975.1 ATP-binding cassette domain-containing protein [Saccharopolyspora sp. 7B]